MEPVALRKESVDRNPVAVGSLTTLGVALRKESVDRNLWWGVRKAVGSLSLSARRAWIEIHNGETLNALVCVALRKESVDRNLAWHCINEDVSCRSPQGERG